MLLVKYQIMVREVVRVFVTTNRAWNLKNDKSDLDVFTVLDNIADTFYSSPIAWPPFK